MNTFWIIMQTVRHRFQPMSCNPIFFVLCVCLIRNVYVYLRLCFAKTNSGQTFFAAKEISTKSQFNLWPKSTSIIWGKCQFLVLCTLEEDIRVFKFETIFRWIVGLIGILTQHVNWILFLTFLQIFAYRYMETDQYRVNAFKTYHHPYEFFGTNESTNSHIDVLKITWLITRWFNSNEIL